MTRRTNEPRTVYEDERQITRKQGDLDGAAGFSGGSFPDLPGSSVPTNGFMLLQNWRANLRFCFPRTGSKRWSETSIPGVAYDTPHGWNVNESERKVVLHVGTSLYITTYAMTTWTQIKCISQYAIDGEDSYLWPERHNMMIWCNGKIFKVDLSVDEPMYWQSNTAVPTTKITSVASAADKQSGRRYVYAQTQLKGATLNQSRLTDGISINQESGTTLYQDGDFGEVFNATPPTASYPLTIGVLEVAENSRHLPFFTVYSTMDLGDNGIDPVTKRKNKPHQYVFNTDIPVCKSFVGSVDVSGNLVLSSGQVYAFDAGNLVTDIAGNVFKISSVLNSVQCSLTDSDGSAYSGGVLASTSWALGQTVTVRTCQQNATTVSRDAGAVFTIDDVQKPLFFSDGGVVWITAFVDGDTVTVSHNGNRGPLAVGADPTGRYYSDNVPDATLRSRLGFWPCRNRFYEPFPEGDIGGMLNSIIFTAKRGNDTGYYSSLPYGYEELVGYYVPGEQEFRTYDAIYGFAAMTDKMVVLCSHSTGVALLNTMQVIEDEETGESYVLLDFNIKDHQIGTKASRGFDSVGDGRLAVFTSEPGIRIFDGGSYGDRLDENRINKILRKVDPESIVLKYDWQNGIQWWTTQDYDSSETGEATGIIDESGDRTEFMIEGN